MKRIAILLFVATLLAACGGQPASKPDRIVFESDRDGNKEIYVMNADGSGQTRLTDSPEGACGAAWSPHGARIAFASLRDGSEEVYVINADDTGQTRLTNDPGADKWPTWCP